MAFQEKPKSSLNPRSMTSFMLTISFLVVLLSGIALYIAPKGRVAHWTGWQFLSLTREQWVALHITLSLLFLISCISHLVFNWKVLVNYLKTRKDRKVGRIPELIVSLVICAFFVIGTLLVAPPLSGIMGLRTSFQEATGSNMTAPPRWHAEISTVAKFAGMIGLTTDQVAQALKTEGYPINAPTETIAKLAERHNTTPMALYEAILKHHPQAIRSPGQGRHQD